MCSTTAASFLDSEIGESHLNSRVIRVEEIKRNIYSVLLECPEIACSAEPGQFVHIAVSSLGSTDPLLRRPMSICDEIGRASCRERV